MIDGFVQAVLKEVKEEYPHISTPSILRAKIIAVKKKNAYEKEVTIEWEGVERQCKLKDYYYSYSLKIISESGENNTKYPAVPNIKSKEKYAVGDIVTVALLDGELDPVIIGG